MIEILYSRHFEYSPCVGAHIIGSIRHSVLEKLPQQFLNPAVSEGGQ